MPQVSLMKLLGIPTPTVQDVQKRDGVADTLIDGYFDMDGSLVKRPGFTLFKDFSSSAHPIQGIWESPVTGNVYVVYNNLLVKVASNGTPTTITGTTLTTDAAYASFTHDGSFAYVANNSAINKITEGAGTAAALTGGTTPSNVTHVNFLKGFILSNGLQSGGVAGDTNFSDDNGANWELYNNEHHPDASTALWIRADEVAAFGPYSMESSYNDGVTPWGLIQGSDLDWGLRAPYSVVLHHGAFMFFSVVDNYVRFVRMDIRDPQDISQRYWKTFGGLSDAANVKAWGVTWNGIPFYIATFPTDSITFVYNILRNEWYQWGTWGGSAYTKWPINAYAYIRGWNKHLIGDATDAKLYYLDGAVTDASTAIRMRYRTASIDHGSARAKIQDQLFFRIKRGQASDSSEPTFSVASSDNGKAYRTARTVSLGLTGDYDYFGTLLTGGRYRSRGYEIIHADTKSDFVMTEMEEAFRWCAN